MAAYMLESRICQALFFIRCFFWVSPFFAIAQYGLLAPYFAIAQYGLLAPYFAIAQYGLLATAIARWAIRLRGRPISLSLNTGSERNACSATPNGVNIDWVTLTPGVAGDYSRQPPTAFIWSGGAFSPEVAHFL